MNSKHCFPPVVDRHTEILILGSLPGDASLAQQQYYAHPQNRFWHLLSEVLGVELIHQTYEQRLQTLLMHRIGLWDVVAHAKRQGSLDSQLKQAEGNDLLGLVDSLPALKTIAFNGGTAAKLGLKILERRREEFSILQLPSSSPAYTLSFDSKLQYWSKLKNGLNKQ